ncbi:S8 family serine peptidase [Luteococcus sp. Sow4_B9]|uniref:S8 family serine peptidase n=1 Tax=Luteococcus sp. Sow4_B9 TaxID=3438792 RepID=UPI003F971A95
MSSTVRTAPLRRHTARALTISLLALVALVLPVNLPESTLLEPPLLGPVPADAAGITRSYLVNARTPGQTTAAQKAAVKAGGQVVQAWPQIGVLVVRSSRGDFARQLQRIGKASVHSVGDARKEAARERVTLNRSVDVKPVGRRVTAAAGRVGKADPMITQQKHLGLDRALQAQKLTPGSSSVLVGILDTGVDDRHRDLTKNFSTGDSVDCTVGGRPNTASGAWRGNDPHGTHVAGTVAASRNGYGVSGIAPGARVASIKVVNANGEAYPEYLVCGFMWAGLRQMAVTNTSLNMFDLWCGELDIRGAALTALHRAINWSAGRGVTHVSSAGNAGMDVSWQRAEACHDPVAESSRVVHVASVDNTGRLSEFSSYGRTMVDIAAPGEKILSTTPGNRFTARTGTSQAAPQVAGTLALMKSRKPSATPGQLVATLKKTTRTKAVRSIGPECRGTVRNNTCTGAGQLDALAAVQAMR